MAKIVRPVKVKSMSMHMLNNNEYAQFMKGVESLVEIATTEKLVIKDDLFLAFKEDIQLLIDATNQSTQRHETQKLKELDKKRDELSTYLLSVFRTESKSSLANKKEAGTVLYAQTKSYLGISKQPDRQKTNVIDAMIFDLLKDENTKYLKALGLQEVVSELRTTNQKYSKLTEERAENQLKTKLPNVKSIRKELDEVYGFIIDLAYATMLTAPSDEVINFINLMNKLIDDTTTLRKQRVGLIRKTKPETTQQ